MPDGASLAEQICPTLDELGSGGSACLLRREGEVLRPEAIRPDSPTGPREPVSLEAVRGCLADPPGPFPWVLEGDRTLEPLRGIVGPDAACAALSPVPPGEEPAEAEAFILVWLRGDGDRDEPESLPVRAARLAGQAAREMMEHDNEGAHPDARLIFRGLEASSLGMLLVDGAGRILWLNESARRAPGPGARMTPGDSLFRKLCASSAERLRRLMKAAQGGAFSSEELDFAFEPTGQRIFHVVVDLIRTESSDSFLVSLRSLTERDRLVELLRREKNFTRSLLDAANACVLGLDVQGRTILFNKVFQDLSNFRLADILGRDAVDILVDEENKSAWREAHLKALGTEQIEDQDFQIRTQDGQGRILCMSAGRINDEAGVCRGVLWTGRDVTDERNREQSLRYREEATSRSLSQLKEFSRISSEILQEKSLDAVCKMFVDAISEVSTFRRAILTLCDEDFRGYQWYFAGLSQEDIDTFHRNKMTQRERVTIFQERFRLGNSYYIPATEGWHYEGVRSQAHTIGMVDWHPDDFLFIPLYGSNRKVVGVVSVDDPEDGCRPTAESLSALELFANQVAHSIEEKKLDLEVKQSTLRYRTLVETMYEGVFSVDLRERILLANAAMVHLLGLPESLINGRPLGSIMEPDDLRLFREETGLHGTGREARFEIRLMKESGEKIPVLVSATPFKEEGAVKGCFAVIRDLRQEKAAEVERKAMQEQLAQAEKLSALGELISGIAHELNNPLTGVMGYSQLLLGKEEGGQSKQELQKIHREAVRCQKIVQNLLTFARRRSPERKRIDVNELVRSTLELRAYQLKVDGVEVVTDLAADLPSSLGDFHQIQQVFINLINNAHHALLEAGNPGRLEISTRNSGEYISVTFQDNGPGIPEDRIQKIFDPFFTTKAIGKGTGLGLSLSYGIIKEHEGRIQVESPPGRGARFRVDLPISAGPAEAAEEAPAEAPGAPLDGKRILIVDDEETILDLLRSVLLSAGHEVETAANGREALRKVEKEDFDIIISDLKMPDMGGQKLYECISEIKPHLKERMIFSTGDTVNPVTQELFQKTGNLHLAKPFRLEEVNEIIRKALEGGEGGGRAS